MPRFAQSVSGRIMAASFAVALVGGGISTQLEAPTSLYVMALSIFVAIAANIVGLALALEDFLFEAMLSAIGLPVALWLYAIGLGWITTYHPAAGYALTAAGLFSLGIALRPTARSVDVYPRKQVRAAAH